MSEPSDWKQMLAQAQEMSARLQRVQAELRLRTVEASVGGGTVVARANGRGELIGLRIEPGSFDAREPGMLQDLIVAAVNEALRRAGELAREEMQQATGIPLAGLLGALGGRE